jgi:hypothetical protein
LTTIINKPQACGNPNGASQTIFVRQEISKQQHNTAAKDNYSGTLSFKHA